MKRPVSTVGYAQIGGILCLDFANTLAGARGGSTRELLTHYRHLADWSRMVGTISRAQAKALGERAEEVPARAEEVLARAVALREAIFRVVAGYIAKRVPPARDLALIATETATAIAHATLLPAATRFEWVFVNAPLELDAPLWPIARSASDLLTSDRIHRVRECASDTCTWLFYDSSKNHSRRWCDMRDCGNRAKVRRHRNQ
jgi:predicted RNA-binding Zn ribbon-like protein